MPDFPSGQWTGFYTYSGSQQRHLMDLVLEFKAGVVSGEGADGIGLFIIAGHYSESAGECDWIKTYIRRHSVAYRGFREGKGIWGTWTITPWQGGFHIWPLGQNAEPLAEVAESSESLSPTPFLHPARPRPLEPVQ